jgi:hypothetical protein
MAVPPWPPVFREPVDTQPLGTGQEGVEPASRARPVGRRAAIAGFVVLIAAVVVLVVALLS